MSEPNYRITYGGSTPGSSDTVTLTSELDVAGKGLKWYALLLSHSHAGTVNIYERTTDSATERLVQSTSVTPGSTPSRVTCYIEPFRQIIVKFANGASAQTTFEVNQCFSDEEPISQVEVTGTVSVTGTVGIGVDPTGSDRVAGKQSLTTATNQQVIASPGVGYKLVITGMMASNGHASQQVLATVRSGVSTTNIREMYLAAGGGGFVACDPDGVLVCGENEGLSIEQDAAGTLKFSAWGYRKAV